MASSSSNLEEDCEKFKGEDEPLCCEQRSITETVINGSMKETVSLTVDAKTETAVFKRFVKLSTCNKTNTKQKKHSLVYFFVACFSSCQKSQTRAHLQMDEYQCLVGSVTEVCCECFNSFFKHKTISLLESSVADIKADNNVHFAQNIDLLIY